MQMLHLNAVVVIKFVASTALNIMKHAMTAEKVFVGIAHCSIVAVNGVVTVIRKNVNHAWKDVVVAIIDYY